MRGRALLTAVTIALAGVTLAAGAGPVRVQPIVTEGRVKVSFSATDAWTIETREFLQLGQAVTFDYYIELRRPSTLWLDPLIAKTNVQATAKFDSLAGRYLVSRQRDGNVAIADKREQENDVREWLTVFEPVELHPESALRANTDYYIQVRLYKYPRANSSLWSVIPAMPFGRDDSSGRAAFTYLR